MDKDGPLNATAVGQDRGPPRARYKMTIPCIYLENNRIMRGFKSLFITIYQNNKQIVLG